MSAESKKTKFKWLDKLKNIKHIELYITIIFIVILLLIFSSNFGFGGSKSSNKSITHDLTVTEYVNDLETNLEKILTNVEGVTNVKVMITLDMGQAEVVDSKINLNKFPNIKGIIITANGVNDTTTKMRVLHAVQAVIDITNGNIEILSSN